jgi:ribosome-associated protein
MFDELLQIDDQVSIPLGELRFRYARSGGPGGQHVQRTETKVELLFDVANSPSLDEAQRLRLIDRLGSRVDSEGVLHLTSQAGRSQLENRKDVVERFQHLLAAALRPRKKRRATRPSAQARQRRLDAKRRRGHIKRLRGRVSGEE